MKFQLVHKGCLRMIKKVFLVIFSAILFSSIGTSSAIPNSMVVIGSENSANAASQSNNFVSTKTLYVSGFAAALATGAILLANGHHSSGSASAPTAPPFITVVGHTDGTNGVILTSSDGITWDQQTSGGTVPNETLYGVR